MAIRDVQPMPFVPAGLSDSLDGNMSRRGGMLSCSNLMPSITTPGMFIPRPAAFPVITFAGTPAFNSTSTGSNTSTTLNDTTRTLPVNAYAGGIIYIIGGTGIGQSRTVASNTATQVTVGAAWSVTPDATSVYSLQPTAAKLGFASPGYVSCMIQVGTRVWGMLSTARNLGYDEPFCYDFATNAFVPIGGILPTNVPASPATSGAWTPPSICAVGSYIVFTHPGYSGTGSNFFGVISGAGGASPAYNSYNTATNALPSAPTWCANFNGRVYFACGNTAYYTDVLAPTTMTNATNSLTMGGSDPITSMSPQPYFTTTAGGIAQALLVFKAFGIWQIQGDLALSTLSLNQVISGVGTQSPRSPAVTPNGVAFLAIDGIRNVGLDGQVSVPVGEVNKPFMTALTPTRTACAYNQGTYRAVVDFLQGGSYEKFEYWWDEIRQIWTGPHTLTYDNIIPSGASFLVTSATNTGVIYQSNVLPGATDNFTEFGSPLSFVYQTGVLPEDTSILSEKALIEHTIFMGFTAQQQIEFQALDPSSNVLSTYNFTTPLIAPSGPTSYGVFWSAPIIFNRMSIMISGQSSGGLQLGAMYLHYQALGYINVDPSLSLSLPPNYDWGQVSDPVIETAGDWGSVADPALSMVDFGPTGVLP
jgi:hypothetical protein